MSRYKKQTEEVNQTWNTLEPSELDHLRADMNKKTQIRMNGRLQSRWVQVMLDRGVIKLNEWGNHVMCNPSEYLRMQKAEAMIAAADVKEEERLFREHPELEVEAKERFQRFVKETREAVFGVSNNMKLTQPTVENKG